MQCTKKIFRQKLLQITIRNFWYKNVFDRPMGVASALIAEFGFLVKSALKVGCTKFSYQTKVVTNQYLQLLCNVTFFDILHHYGVIAAFQICSASRKYCAVLRNRFFFLEYAGLLDTKYLFYSINPSRTGWREMQAFHLTYATHPDSKGQFTLFYTS